VRDHAKAQVRRLRRQRDAEQKAIRPDGGPALVGTGRIQGPDEGPWNAERRRQDALDAPGKPREKWGGSAFAPTGRLRVADADYLVDIDSEYPLLTMAKLWGMSQAEIARALKVTTRTVRTRMKAERERLEASARARSLIS
jgi:DNA-binding CsgD family transcriptional regulator